MKTLKKIVFIGLLVLIACAGVAQAQELYKDEKAPMHERIMDLLSRLTVEEFYLNTLRKENDIDWIFLSPAANMTPGERTGKFRIGKDDLVVDVNGDSNISVEDYAVAMVDELEQKKYHKERFTIGY